MKTISTIILVLSSLLALGQNINFEDTNFKQYLIDSGFDLDNDGGISESEALAVTQIKAAGQDLTNLSGIEYFKNITWLDVQTNALTSLDLRTLTVLQNLYVARNQLQEIKLAGLEGLATISAANNLLRNIELRNLPRLSNLYIDNNPFSTLDLSELPNLQRINTRGTEIVNLDFTSNPKMFDISVSNSPISSLDLTGLCSLRSVTCRDTPLKSIDLSDCITLNRFSASRSSLEEIILKNGVTESMLEIESLSQLKRICADDDQVSSVQQLVMSLGYTNVTVDSNCEGPQALSTYYKDLDNDGFGDSNTGEASCQQPGGTVLMGGDCDDTDPSIYPGAIELCDSKDNNCNGNADEGLALITYYLDQDGDGYGDSNTSESNCQQPGGTVFVGGDCDDTDPSIYPGAIELCDSKDNNCNGSADEGLALTIYYLDQDGDGYGDDNSAIEDCMQLSGMVTTQGDCDDTDPNINPAADEIPNNAIDENCDGDIETSSTHALASNSLSLYPNPVNDQLFLTSHHNEITDLKLYTIDGQLVDHKQINAYTTTVELQQYDAGSYILMLNLGPDQYVEQLFIIK